MGVCWEYVESLCAVSCLVMASCASVLYIFRSQLLHHPRYHNARLAECAKGGDSNILVLGSILESNLGTTSFTSLILLKWLSNKTRSQWHMSSPVRASHEYILPSMALEDKVTMAHVISSPGFPRVHITFNGFRRQGRNGTCHLKSGLPTST